MPENISLIADRCDGCEECLRACPFFALEIVDGRAAFAESCIECGICVTACPRGAIRLAGEGEESVTTGRGLWVYLLEPGETPALALARSLADELGIGVTAVVGQHPDDPEALFQAGADEVLVLGEDGATLGILHSAAAGESPRAILALGTPRARRILPGLAATLNTGYIAGAVKAETGYGDGSIEFTRPVYGGRFVARLVSEKAPVVTVDPTVYRASRREGGRTGRVRTLSSPAADVAATDSSAACAGGAGGLRLVGEKPARREVALERARVVVSGGPGLKSKENFARLATLAGKLGAAVGASKEAVDAGWAAPEQLVDTAGHQVNADLYLAFGIDGSPTHNAAVAGSKVIAVVTDNREANILGQADYILDLDPVAALDAFLAAL